MAYYESNITLTPPLVSHPAGPEAPYPDPAGGKPAPKLGDSSDDYPIIAVPPGVPKYVGAMDIETLGPDPRKHSLVGMGAVVVDVATNRVVRDFSCFMSVDKEAGYGYDPVCRAEYWDNHAKFPMNVEIKRRFETSNLSTACGVRLFAEWMDACDAEFGEQGMHLVSDTIGYDAAWISYHFGLQLDRLPLDYVGGDPRRYRSLKHANDFAKGGVGLDVFGDGSWRDKLRAMGVEMPDEAKHCHNPRDDAEYIAKTYTGYLRHLIRNSRGRKKQRVEG